MALVGLQQLALGNSGGTTAKKKTPIVQQIANNRVNQTQNLLGSLPNTPAYNTVNTTKIPTLNTSSASSGATTTIPQQPVATVASPAQATQATQASSTSSSQTSDWLSRLEAALKSSYSQSEAARNSWYNNSVGNLRNSLTSGLDTLGSQTEAQKEAIRKEREAAQRQAYIAAQQSERDMGQILAAQGLTGGASESAIASLRNNYGSNRNSNDENYMDSVADITMSYESAYADLQNQYNSLLNALEQQNAAYRMQNENNLSSGTLSTIGNYYQNQSDIDFQKWLQNNDQSFQREYAALQQQYALEQMERDNALSKDYVQYSNALSGRSANSYNTSYDNSYYSDDDSSTTANTATLSTEKVARANNVMKSVNSSMSQVELENRLRQAGLSNTEIALYLQNYA